MPAGSAPPLSVEGRSAGGLAPWQVALLLAVALALLRLPTLPPEPLCWLAALLGVVLLGWRGRRPALLRGLALTLLGAGWTGTVAWLALEQRLSVQDQGAARVIEIEVEGLPRSDALATRFQARILVADDPELLGRRLAISWFADPPPALRPSERWRLPLRMWPPRGLRNPGGFDYERHALVQRIAAQATVVGSGERLAEAKGIDRLRDDIARRIERSAAPSLPLLRALAVGDTRGLQDADWDRLRHTGLSHLVAISGLHVGLVAGFAALLLRGLYWLRPRLGLRLPLPQAAALAALIGATAYALLAGLSLPTLRSLLMLAAALAAVVLRREAGLAQPLALAAATLWLLDPLALLTPGFWLSLAGVFWLLACVPRGQGWRQAALGLLRAQWVLGLALLPLSVAFFGGGSLVGLPLNLLAVPWVTLGVVPVLLLGVLLLGWPAAADLLFQVAGTMLAALWHLAEYGAGLPAAYLHLPQPSTLTLLLALAGLLLALAPRGVPGRAAALLLLVPLLYPHRERLAEGEYQVDLLDVGQGLAVLVRTADHTLLYDTGARTRSGFDLGDAVVVPALRALGVSHLDRILVSHGDSDHAGGLVSARAAFPEAALQAGEPRRLGLAACRAGQRWQWNAVAFALLHPPEHFPELGNESSCVLRIEGVGGRSLLPGDIGQVIEQRLLREQPDRLPAELLIAPHHGSRSSSSAGFVAAVAPRWVAIAAGAGNRFGHPHAEVLARYQAQGASVLDSASSGRLSWRFGAEGPQLETVERRDHRRFWQRADR